MERFSAYKISTQMGAASVEPVPYRDKFTHVCFSTETRGGLAFVDVELHKHEDGTKYGMCNCCKRFFYAAPRKLHGSGYKQFTGTQPKQSPHPQQRRQYDQPYKRAQ